MNPRRPTPEEATLLGEYRAWSEEWHCAGFTPPSPEMVAQFIRRPQRIYPLQDYEIEFLEEHARQIAKDKP